MGAERGIKSVCSKISKLLNLSSSFSRKELRACSIAAQSFRPFVPGYLINRDACIRERFQKSGTDSPRAQDYIKSL